MKYIRLLFLLLLVVTHPTTQKTMQNHHQRKIEETAETGDSEEHSEETGDSEHSEDTGDSEHSEDTGDSEEHSDECEEEKTGEHRLAGEKTEENSESGEKTEEHSESHEEVTIESLSKCELKEKIEECKTAELTPHSYDGECVKAGFLVHEFHEIIEESQMEFLKEHYCANLQNQPISVEQFCFKHEFDNKAKEMYKALYELYHEKKVDQDCLAIARLTFCSYQFKYCDPETGKESQVLCRWLCDAFQARCSSESELYDLMCANTSDTNCVYGEYFTPSLFLLLAFVIQYI